MKFELVEMIGPSGKCMVAKKDIEAFKNRGYKLAPVEAKKEEEAPKKETKKSSKKKDEKESEK